MLVICIKQDIQLILTLIFVKVLIWKFKIIYVTCVCVLRSISVGQHSLQHILSDCNVLDLLYVILIFSFLSFSFFLILYSDV